MRNTRHSGGEDPMLRRGIENPRLGRGPSLFADSPRENASDEQLIRTIAEAESEFEPQVAPAAEILERRLAARTADTVRRDPVIAALSRQVIAACEARDEATAQAVMDRITARFNHLLQAAAAEGE